MPSLNFLSLRILQLLCWLHLKVEFWVRDSHPNAMSLLPCESYCVLGFYFPFIVLIMWWVFDKLLQIPLLDQFFYFILKGNAIFSVVTSNLMILVVLELVSSWWRSILSQQLDRGVLLVLDFPRLWLLSIFTSWYVGFVEDFPHTFSLNLVISSI